jgi:hypothetical protein
MVAEATRRQTLEGFHGSNVAVPEPFARSGWITNAAEWPIGPLDPTDHPLLGFDWVHGYTGTSDITMRSTNLESLRVPYWFVVIATASLPGWSLICSSRRAARRRRAAGGLCAKCGYDLRATPGRCPECGTAGGAVKA